MLLGLYRSHLSEGVLVFKTITTKYEWTLMGLPFSTPLSTGPMPTK